MTKAAWQKMLKLQEERGAQERLSCEKNWLYQSWCDFLSCPGTAWLATARRAIPPCPRRCGSGRFFLQRGQCACSALDMGVNWAHSSISPFLSFYKTGEMSLASSNSWLAVRFLTRQALRSRAASKSVQEGTKPHDGTSEKDYTAGCLLYLHTARGGPEGPFSRAWWAAGLPSYPAGLPLFWDTYLHLYLNIFPLDLIYRSF